MIHNLPFPLQIIVLAVLGGCLGSAVNYAIYAWSWTIRSISPWQSPNPESSPRGPMDRIPVWGWFRLRRDRGRHGRLFWLRPMLLELVWIVGLPWFFFWQQGGGLVGGPLTPMPADWTMVSEIWFWFHTVLLALMCIATFIDFDERTIPDAVTVPGTLFALLLAAIIPGTRLPEVESNLAGQTMTPISFANGEDNPLFGIHPEWLATGVEWHQGSAGLWMALILFWGWTIALLPISCTMRFGFRKAIWLMVFSLLRPPRRKTVALQAIPRGPVRQTKLLLGLGVTGSIALLLAKQYLPPVNWESLFQALFGLGFGGLMIWGIRIVGQLALQKEAMGFGDVTLMAMVGAFLGWQVALLTLPFAVVFALFVTIGMFVVTRDSQLAFGPYLCLGCAVVIFYWSAVWPGSSAYFALGEWLFYILGFMLALMLGLLSALQLAKRGMGLS